MRAYPHCYRTGTGHRVKGGNSWHSNSPLESASCGSLFRRSIRSLWLRPFWLFAPCTDPTETVRCLPGRLGLLHPGFQSVSYPARLPDIVTAPHGDLRRRDLHPLVMPLASLRPFPKLLGAMSAHFSLDVRGRPAAVWNGNGKVTTPAPKQPAAALIAPGSGGPRTPAPPATTAAAPRSCRRRCAQCGPCARCGRPPPRRARPPPRR